METRKLSELKATNIYLRLGTDVSDLENSIQTIGLIAPLVISPDNLILAGARRYQAMLNLGYKETSVIVLDKGELENELVSIDENLVRKDLSKIEIEGHLRRAKEIYQKLNPIDEIHSEENKNESTKKVITLPSEKFFNIISHKTGLSSKQIHQAINRDEMASANVKDARKSGSLSLSQTNEIIKLKKDEQQKSLSHLKSLPVRDIKKFVKIAKASGIQEALKATPVNVYLKEFNEIELCLKKLNKKLNQLKLEGIGLADLPNETQTLFTSLIEFSVDSSIYKYTENKTSEELYTQ